MAHESFWIRYRAKVKIAPCPDGGERFTEFIEVCVLPNPDFLQLDIKYPFTDYKTLGELDTDNDGRLYLTLSASPFSRFITMRTSLDDVDWKVEIENYIEDTSSGFPVLKLISTNTDSSKDNPYEIPLSTDMEVKLQMIKLTYDTPTGTEELTFIVNYE